MAYTEKDKIRHAKWAEENKEKLRAYHREYGKKWSTENKEKRKLIRRKHELKKRYGLTIEQFNQMVLAQNNCCALCKKQQTKKLHVDHCHTTGQIRGLLCGNCNTALGLLKENLTTIESIVNYLNRRNQ
jgi:hypothetical protein